MLRFWNLVICAGLGIRSFAHRSFAQLLRSNERLWAIRSYCSGQMSNCERIAQVAHVKRATVSNSLRSIMINEWRRESLVFWGNCSFALSLTKNEQFALKNLTEIVFFSTFCFKLLIHSFLMSHMSKSSGCSPKMSELLVFWANWWFFEKIAHSLIICSFFCKKTSASLRKPMS